MILLSDSDEQSNSAAYQPTMDLDRFRQLIRAAEHEHSHDPLRMKDAAKSIASALTRTGRYSLMHRMMQHTYTHFAYTPCPKVSGTPTDKLLLNR